MFDFYVTRISSDYFVFRAESEACASAMTEWVAENLAGYDHPVIKPHERVPFNGKVSAALLVALRRLGLSYQMDAVRQKD